MKLKLALALVLVAATAMAAKEPQDFGYGLRGFTKPYMEPTSELTGEGTIEVRFPNVGPKSCITFTEVPYNYFYEVYCSSDIKTKNCKNGVFYNLIVTKDDFSLKAKELSLKGLKVIGGAKLIDICYFKPELDNTMDVGKYAKGTTIKVTASINGPLYGNVKSITSLYFGNDVQFDLYCSTPKILKLTSKLDPATAAQMNYAYLKNDIKVSAKNVNVVEDFH